MLFSIITILYIEYPPQWFRYSRNGARNECAADTVSGTKFRNNNASCMFSYTEFPIISTWNIVRHEENLPQKNLTVRLYYQ